MINWTVISNPYNWVAVVVMGLFGLMLLAIVSPQASPSNTPEISP